MNCLETQSKIIAYIDSHLEKDEKTDFLKHITKCKDCKEELNIYYTMIEGMRQLDSNLPLSRDFSKELDERIDRELKHNKKRQEFFRSSVCIIIIGVLGFCIFGYVNFLNILHAQEQADLKKAQGEYYFSKTFDSVLFEPDEKDHMVEINIDGDKQEPDFYERIRQYKALQQ